ncbi:helix-turn-helix transcriptional regulator [Streptomyces sp. PT12]|uniref:helix-turn-helix domain-containing protein n=1 Tax=Streptomyces sp. PT12 TaxID=1510197 RepID=UPI000DE3AD1A|nr:helix-turn-helix transcriptional regulator [Streptomyces sp. PT12]RBM14156.1 DNA-binding protein [Streptomyces sp. PT12]
MAKPLATMRRKRLGLELKRMREARALDREAVASILQTDLSRISRIETGKATLSRLELSTWLDACEVNDDRLRSGLLQLNAQGRKKGWWQKRGDFIPPTLQEAIDLEQTASVIFEHRQAFVPGLLQTAEYAEAMIRSFPLVGGGTVEEGVQVRMTRQEVLDGPSAPQAFWILDEAALHREVGGPKVMAGQLRKLLDAGNPPHLNIQVLPFRRGAYHCISSSFHLFTYKEPSEMDLVLVEYERGRLFLEEDYDVEPFRRSSDRLRDQALSTEDSKELISSIMQSFERN